MKRLIIIGAAAAALLFGMPVFAENTENSTSEPIRVYPNAYALYSVGWGGGYPYPEGVTGVWSATGGTDLLVIGIAADSDVEQVKADILAQIENKESVEFLVQDHSHELLHEIYGNVAAERENYNADDVYTWSISESGNCVIIGADIEHPSPELQQFMEACKAQYGDAVQFTECEGISPTAAEPPEDSHEADEPIEAIPQEEAVTESPAMDSSEPETETGAVTIEKTDDESPVAEEGYLDAGGEQDYSGAVPGLGTVGMESEDAPHHRLLPILAAGLLLLAGIGAVLLRRRAAQKLLQSSSGTVSVQHPDIPALMQQTAAEPPESLRQQILDAAKKQ